MTKPGPEFTDRDRTLLRSLVEYRLLTTEQVQRLHFPSAQTALRRLRRLEDAGLIRRARSHALATHAITLTGRGVTFARGADATDTGDSTPGRRPVRLPGEFFLRHMVAVNDFRIALELACLKRPDIDLLGFIADRESTSVGPAHQPRSVLAEAVSIGVAPEERLVHVPDAAFALRGRQRQALFLVEVDRGTEVIGDPTRGVGRFVRFYLHGLLTGAFRGLGERLGGELGFRSFRVLVVTTSEARIAAIRRRWGSMPVEPELAKRFIWLSTTDALLSRGLLEHRWVSLDPHDEGHYVIAPPSGEARA